MKHEEIISLNPEWVKGKSKEAVVEALKHHNPEDVEKAYDELNLPAKAEKVKDK